MDREYRLSKLYFKHIHKTPLQSRGVTVDDLAKTLQDAGFIQLRPDGKYIETQAFFDPNEKIRYFRVIWNTQPKAVSRG